VEAAVGDVSGAQHEVELRVLDRFEPERQLLAHVDKEESLAMRLTC
jgi:hypothetical protein